MNLQTIPLTLIDRPLHPDRLTLDHNALNELALSIRNEGLLQPIVVRPTNGDRYEIVAGDRRYQAVQSLRHLEIPCIVRTDLEGLSADARLGENLHRTDLTPMEQALAVQRLTYNTNLTTTSIASRLHRSLTWVQQRRDLLDIPDDLKHHVHDRTIAIRTALHLARVDDDAHRAHLLEYAIRSGASADVIREWVNEWTTNHDAGSAENTATPTLPPPGDPVIVLVPCYICHTPTPHTRMAIMRLCTDCHAGINDEHADGSKG